jgi:hypothetical protein
MTDTDANINTTVSSHFTLWERRFEEGVVHLISMIGPKFINSMQRREIMCCTEYTWMLYIKRKMIAPEWDLAQAGPESHRPTGPNGAPDRPMTDPVTGPTRPWTKCLESGLFFSAVASVCSYIPCRLGILLVMYKQGLFSGPDMVEICRNDRGERNTRKKTPGSSNDPYVYSICSINAHRDHDETWIR